MAEWKVNPVVLYAPDGDDIDSAWQKEIAQVEAIIGYLNRLRTGDAGSGLSVPDAVAYSIKIDTSTNPATIYMRNAENNAYIKLGTLEPHFGITGDDIGSVDAEGFGKMTFGKAEDRPSTANPKDLYWAYDEKKVYIWDNGGWDTMLSMNYKDIEHLDENVVLKTNIALSGPNKILLLDDDGKANVDITGSPARINGQLVKVDGLADGDVLQYDAKSQSWKNVPKDELTEARDVSSTGTPGKIVRADTYGNMNANAKVIATKPVTLATGLKDGDALVYDKTADAFLNTPVATVNSSGIADINISGNAAKVAGVPVKTDDNLGDGQTLVYRADRNAFVNESKSTVGAGQSLYIKNGDDVIATYSGDKVADVDISKAVYDTKYFRQPNTEYAVGDRVLVKALQNGLQLECKTAGTTSVKELDCGTAKLGDAVADGSAVWTVVRPQLTTDSIASIAALKPSVDKLPYYTGTETADLTAFTDVARNLLSKPTASEMRDVLEMSKGTASALATPRKIELTGNVTGSADFDGSKNIQIATATPLCVPLAEHITWTVTGTQQGDFDSLQTALNEAKKYRPIAEGALITIKLLSGFELDEPIRVSRCDLRHVEITAEDSKVIANTSKVAALMPTVPNYSVWSVLNYLLFIQFYKAFAPTLRFILRKDNNNGSGYNNCDGIDYNYAQGYIDGGGCENFKIGANESYGVNITCSNLSVLDSTFSDCCGGITTNKNSSLLVRNSTFTDFLNRGIALWGGTGEIQGCTIDGSSQYGIIFAHCEASISEYNTESDSADTRRTKISNCLNGVAFDFGGTAAINRVDITGCRTGVMLENPGNLVRIGTDTNISGNTNNYNIATNTITSQGLILTA